MLENKLQFMKTKVRNRMIGTLFAVISCIGGCGPQYTPASYTPPFIVQTAPTLPDLRKVENYISGSTGEYCDIKVTPDTVACKGSKCTSYVTKPTEHCERVYPPKPIFGDNSRERITIECETKDETQCVKYEPITVWELSRTKFCYGITAEYEVDSDDETTRKPVIKVLYENDKSVQEIEVRTSPLDVRTSTSVRQLTDFINQHYCKRN